MSKATEAPLFTGAELRRRQIAAGYTLEELEQILAPMAEDGKETLASMGDDTPAAVLSMNYRPLSHYFRQNFSQVTNPPIDSLREFRVMSLKTRFGNLKNVLDEDSSQTEIIVLDSPFVANAQFDRMVEAFNAPMVEIDCTFEGGKGPGTLRAALTRVRERAEEAVRSGAGHIVLTDQHVDEHRVAMPMILATSAVHSWLTRQGAADLHLAERPVGGMHRPALLRGADLLRGDDGERLSRRGQPRRPASSGVCSRGRSRRSSRATARRSTRGC